MLIDLLITYLVFQTSSQHAFWKFSLALTVPGNFHGLIWAEGQWLFLSNGDGSSANSLESPDWFTDDCISLQQIFQVLIKSLQTSLLSVFFIRCS